jgi:hypothetical protein
MMKADTNRDRQGKRETPANIPATDNLDELEHKRKTGRLEQSADSGQDSSHAVPPNGNAPDVIYIGASGEAAAPQPEPRRVKTTKAGPSAAMSFLIYVMLFFGAAFLSALVVFSVRS